MDKSPILAVLASLGKDLDAWDQRVIDIGIDDYINYKAGVRIRCYDKNESGVVVAADLFVGPRYSKATAPSEDCTLTKIVLNTDEIKAFRQALVDRRQTRALIGKTEQAKNRSFGESVLTLRGF